MTDTELSETFLIPERMLNRWKNANDYRYLIYEFLEKSNKSAIEGFFNFQYSQTNDIVFRSKNDFVSELEKGLPGLTEEKYTPIKQEDLNMVIKEKPDPKDQNKKILELQLPIYTFIGKKDQNLVYVELCNRIPDEKALGKKIDTIQKSTNDELTLKQMIFITTENDLPKFIRDKPCADMDDFAQYCINDVIIKNVKIDEFVKDRMQAKKIIFISDSKENFQHKYISTGKSEKEKNDMKSGKKEAQEASKINNFDAEADLLEIKEMFKLNEDEEDDPLLDMIKQSSSDDENEYIIPVEE